MWKKRKQGVAFTLIEILISTLLAMIVMTFLYRAFISQTRQTTKLVQKTELEIKTVMAIDRLSRAIAGGGFNPRGRPYQYDALDGNDQNNLERKINFFCLGEKKLYFASDRGSGSYASFTENDYDGKINQPANCSIVDPTLCGSTGDLSNCPMNQADPRETTLYEFNPEADGTYTLYKNVEPTSNFTNGAPVLANIVRAQFSYSVSGPDDVGSFADKVGLIDKICDLKMIQLRLVVRSAAPIRHYVNDHFNGNAAEMALVKMTGGDYQTLEFTKNIFLKNRGMIKVGEVVQPLCFKPEP